jgi:DNA helicase-2/ATP-dependent DNA helicase PcrA
VAANVIGHNDERVKKDLIASDPAKDGSVDVENGPGASSSLASVYLRDLLAAGVAHTDLVVLVRKYSQAHALQATLLTQEVPYFVEGGSAWDKSPAVRLALAYLDLVHGLNTAVDEALLQAAMDAINAPNRYVKRTVFEARLRRAMMRGESLRDVLNQPWDMVRDGLARGAVDRLDELEDLLRRLGSGQPRGRLKRLASDRREAPGAGEVLLQLLDELDLEEHFHEAGTGGADEDSVELIRGLAVLLQGAQTPLEGARAFVQELDTRRGKPEEECVKITSVFKAKGLEWDHVLLPGLLEHLHPDLRPFSDAAMDGRADAESIPPTDALESERRLFYVALTRARESVAIFADPEPKRPASRFLEELALEPTRAAVQGLQGRKLRLLKNAARNPYLHGNILRALERQGEEALAKKLRRMKPAPFQYKGRYDSGVRLVYPGGGLPF